MAPTQKTKRGKNFTDFEDVCLARAWVAVSEDPIRGKDQASVVLWSRISKVFHSLTPDTTVRSDASLSNRWHGTIRPDVQAFVAKHKEIERLNPSGYSNPDKVVYFNII